MKEKCDEGGDSTSNLGKILGTALNCSDETKQSQDKLRKMLKKLGAQEQLIMFLTGPGGCGKSTSIEVAQEFCHQFCNYAAIAFSDKTFYFTSTTGSSAALFGGTTIHTAAHLNKKSQR